MSDKELRPALREDVEQALSFALRFDGKKPMKHAEPLMAKIVAEHIANHLEKSGFVISRRPPRAAPTASHHLPDRDEE